MKRIKKNMFRFGEKDFDLDYMKWGFHDKETQINEAKSILNILKPKKKLKILDLGCGIGTHAVYWAKKSHSVTGEDISKTFINKAKANAKQEKTDVTFIACGINDLNFKNEFDLITSIEFFPSEMNILRKIYKFLCKNGHFIFDVRNPDNPKIKKRTGNWRSWEERYGKFYLERHETNITTGIHVDAWITIDLRKKIIEEKISKGKASQSKLISRDKIKILKSIGFKKIELRTMDGKKFKKGEKPYWLWCIAKKY